MEKQSRTMLELKKQNKALGHHFFSRGALSFFKSKVETRLIDGRWFITSEAGAFDKARRFTIREGRADGSINTIGEFQQYRTKDDALDALSKILNEGL